MSEQRLAPEDLALVADFARTGAELLQGKEALADARGISREQLDGLFQFCYDRYLNGAYDMAARGFRLLCIYDHASAGNWQGYGYSLLALKDYRKAATCLAFGSLYLEQGSGAWADAHLHIAKALTHAGEPGAALEMLDTLMAGTGDGGVTEEAGALREALEAKLGRAGASA